MGHAHFCLGEYAEAVEAYKQGLLLDPENLIMKQSLATAEVKVKEQQDQEGGISSNSPSGNTPRGGAPGGFDFAGMMQNPQFMAMAQNMMSNPAMASMMNNPAMAQMAQSINLIISD